ncbi:NYN domain-containing protein [Rhodoblastus sp.]|uniref:NYN domain-containing protein n=1 Tax=Rhodoblastus sp. TaxID=1962975 RepID=UPI0025EBF4C5|nr:NYN domain-containing protein [Rhodoblastus sp.]
MFFAPFPTKKIELKMASSRLSAKNGPEEPVSRLAVLIDGDNAQALAIEGILAEVARFGEATVKRIYGDFTAGPSSSWNEILQEYAIKPVQQFAYTPRKNATDIALVIDAMDLLYTRNFDGFCLVSSDSDFTGLATRIREEGLKVLGFGAHKTPCAFQNACDEFMFIEALCRSKAETASVAANANAAPEAAPKKPASASVPVRKFPKEIALNALEQSSDENGWVHLGTFGSNLNRLDPNFDPRAFGYKKLSHLVKGRTDLFTTEARPVPGQSSENLYLRAK